MRVIIDDHALIKQVYLMQVIKRRGYLLTLRLFLADYEHHTRKNIAIECGINH